METIPYFPHNVVFVGLQDLLFGWLGSLNPIVDCREI
jgi:hypothetical protein